MAGRGGLVAFDNPSSTHPGDSIDTAASMGSHDVCNITDRQQENIKFFCSKAMRQWPDQKPASNERRCDDAIQGENSRVRRITRAITEGSGGLVLGNFACSRLSGTLSPEELSSYGADAGVEGCSSFWFTQSSRVFAEIRFDYISAMRLSSHA
jgi:hypothetical protein